MLVRHPVTRKEHTLTKAQYDSLTAAGVKYIVLDDTDYVPEELKGEAVTDNVNDNTPDADAKPAEGKAKAKKPKSE